jgi:hypothetical protein
MLSCRTKEEILVCLKYCLKLLVKDADTAYTGDTYARTFENSEDGDMTKLSLLLDHEMRCWID